MLSQEDVFSFCDFVIICNMGLETANAYNVQKNFRITNFLIDMARKIVAASISLASKESCKTWNVCRLDLWKPQSVSADLMLQLEQKQITVMCESSQSPFYSKYGPRKNQCCAKLSCDALDNVPCCRV